MVNIRSGKIGTQAIVVTTHGGIQYTARVTWEEGGRVRVQAEGGFVLDSHARRTVQRWAERVEVPRVLPRTLLIEDEAPVATPASPEPEPGPPAEPLASSAAEPPVIEAAQPELVEVKQLEPAAPWVAEKPAPRQRQPTGRGRQR